MFNFFNRPKPQPVTAPPEKPRLILDHEELRILCDSLDRESEREFVDATNLLQALGNDYNPQNRSHVKLLKIWQTLYKKAVEENKEQAKTQERELNEAITRFVSQGEGKTTE